MIFSFFITQDCAFVTNAVQILVFGSRSECDRKEEDDDNKNYRKTDETAEETICGAGCGTFRISKIGSGKIGFD